MNSFLALAAAALLFVGCQSKQEAPLSTASIHATSMVCGSCAKTVQSALSKVEGVREVDVDLKTKIVEVKYVPQQTNIEALERAVTAAGYDANSRKRDRDAYEKLDKCCKIDG